MMSFLRPAVVMILLFTALTGLAYPLAMTGMIQMAMPARANGSLIERENKIVGSVLIGQSFTSDRYFHARPSAAGQNGYDAAASSGSNLGTLSKKLIDRVAADVEKLRAGRSVAVPQDAVTTSASGLDPDISPANAESQIDRVAKARRMAPAQVREIVARHTDMPLAELLGEPKVNVLLLNLSLDAIAATGPG